MSDSILTDHLKFVNNTKFNDHRRSNVVKRHHYNTRLSGKFTAKPCINKELIVDLSNSRIKPKLSNCEENSVFAIINYETSPEDEEFPTLTFAELETPTRLFYNLSDSREFSSRNTSSSEDSSISITAQKKDFLGSILSETSSTKTKIKKKRVNYISSNNMDMDFERPCMPRRQGQQGGGSWWKNNSMYLITFVGFVFGVYPVYSEVMRNLTKITKDIAHFKGKINDIANEQMDIISKISKFQKSNTEIKYAEDNLRQSLVNMLEEEINKLYADKTKRTDFALESAGGRIVQLSPGTENYGGAKSSLFGVSLCESMHGPRAMIQMGMAPGECWAIKGSNGGAILKLLGSVNINAVSLEHIPKDISPSGDSSTAPKDFAVWGLTSPTDKGQLLGQFVYRVPGSLVQIFSLPHPAARAFDYVEFKVLSNNGHPDFTCVYRFRVHGELDTNNVNKNNAKGTTKSTRLD